MTDFTFHKINESFVKVLVKEPNYNFVLSDYFKFRAPNYFWNKKYKSGVWDGYIRLYNTKQQLLPYGLLKPALKYVKELGLTYELDGDFKFKQYKEETVKKFINDLNLPFEIRDYQFKGLMIALNKGRVLLISPTASGKSLIIYLYIRLLLMQLKFNEKILLIVPRVSLVEQMYNDFIEYGWGNIDAFVHKIYSGKEKNTHKKVIISTWQSLQNMKPKFFHWFKSVIVDEAHTIEGVGANDKKYKSVKSNVKVLQHIMENCINAKYRLGLTGTIKDSKISDMQLISYFGDICNITNFKELVQNNFVSPLKINIIKLKYNHQNFKKYFDEIDFILNNKERMKFLLNLIIKKCDKTSIVLFQRVKHGKQILKYVYNYYKSKGIKRNIAYIDGSIVWFNGKTYRDIKKREDVRQFAFENPDDDLLIIASYGTFSTGINIKNIHKIIFAHPLKSKITIIQSIGRGLRKDERKSQVVIYDLVDMFKYGKRHGEEREKQYVKEEFPYDIFVKEIKN